MTYQKPIPNYDNADADQASLLVLTAVDASPSISLGQGGGVPARKKKNGVPTMRARIVLICFLLGIFAVIYYGGRGSSHTSSSDISDALLLGHNQAAPLYDPKRDHCFTDEQHHGKFCWFPLSHIVPCGGGRWKGSKGDFGKCGEKCTKVLCYRDDGSGSCVSNPPETPQECQAPR